MSIIAVGYLQLKENIITNNQKNNKILFYSIQNRTSELLSDLLYQYSFQKKILIEKHRIVREYIASQETRPFDINLNEIYAIINKEVENNPYNIYISDKNLLIKNSTYKEDIKFDLNFAKESFDKHFEENITGVSSPLLEKSSKQFVSYTDVYLDINKSAVLQVSYTYKNSKKRLLEIRNILSLYPNIVDAKAYIIVNTGFINDIILKKYKSYKPNLNEILARIKDGESIRNKLTHKKLMIDKFIENGTTYNKMYLSSQSVIFEDTQIVYSILLDESELMTKLFNLDIIIFIITLLGVTAILIINKLRKREVQFGEQDKFVQSSMHEIKTPLSIITLNNELRELEFGKDEYSTEIESAIKTLKTSYEDMSFTITKDNLAYPIELFSLGEVLRDRVEYFSTIAKSNSKSINLEIVSECQFQISQVELIRLIDNNLSNAIKYSDTKSEITVKLQNNLLTFHNIGKPIENSKKVFDKYHRENFVIGGHGLGLNIVKEIAKKYFITISLNSTVAKGTTFSYKFKCHTIDI